MGDHLPQPSELLMNKKMISDSPEATQIVDAIMIFREGVEPMWEDKANAEGGHFEFKFRANQNVKGAKIDEYWNNLVCGIIGGVVDPNDMITGVRLVDKLNSKGHGFLRIEVWFSNWNDT